MSDVPDLPTIHSSGEGAGVAPLTLDRWAEMRGISPGEILVVEDTPASVDPVAPEESPTTPDTSRDDSTPIRRVEGYHVRQVPGTGSTDVDLLRRSGVEGMPVLLYGLPGCGKTALVEAAFGDDLVTTVGTVDTDTTDLIGGWTPTGDPGAPYRWEPGPLTVAVEEGRPLLVDEIALIDPRVLSVLYSVMDGRDTLHLPTHPTAKTVPVADGFYVVGACNPDAPGAVMSEALLSRFAVHLEVTTDYGVLSHLGVEKTIIEVAINLATMARTHEIRYAPQTRDLLTFMRVREVWGLTAALSNLVSSARPSDRESYSEVIATTYGRQVGPLSV